MARAVKIWQVKIGNNGRTIACAEDETILHAAIVAGIDYPYACATGNCGTCISKLDEGKVSMLPRGDASLTAAQAASGQTLACRALPVGDVGITWLGRGRR
jgi:ferredoxin